jgi:RHS repeat-associated protein
MYALPFGSGGNDQFAGHKDDPESGLHYNLARSYNPIMSRWPSADSVTQNIYVDPNGNFWNPFGGIWDLIVAIGTAISNWANNLDGGQYPPSILPILYMYANPEPFPETTSGGGGGDDVFLHHCCKMQQGKYGIFQVAQVL